jgi:NADP-dependent 3-hydroxy acid dehydrogenase YdfG/acyl carrier protein
MLGAEDCQAAGSLRDDGLELSLHSDLRSLGEAIAAGAPVPEVVLVDCTIGGGASLKATRALLKRVLSLVQGWLSDERLAAGRLVLLTRGAVSTHPEEDTPNLAAAAAWGLIRSAQSEHPDRFVLVDIDEVSWSGGLVAALAAGEPQAAIRGGQVHVARLARVAPENGMSFPELASTDRAGTLDVQETHAFAGNGTVLITGGTGELGALFAEHLVVEHGARGVLLVSRQGAAAPSAGELRQRLTELGAHVEIAACDVADRNQLQGLIDAIPDERPLRAVVHAAGVLDDGVIDSLTEARIERVIAPKVGGALALHELTKDLDLDAFVLFSSMSGVLGSAGQASYAAANCFLDALAVHRRALGLNAQSLAWGLWANSAGEIADGTGRTATTRMAGSGVTPLSVEEGLVLFDAARRLSRAVVLPIRLDLSVVRSQVHAGVIPALLRGLVSMPSRHLDRDSFRRRMAAVSEEDREAIVAELVRAEVASVLGHASALAIDPRDAFKDLGFDSLIAVELRNRLSVATGLSLPATLVFDYPTPERLATHLKLLAFPLVEGGGEEERVESDLRDLIASIPLERLRETGMLRQLMLLASTDEIDASIEDGDGGEKIDTMDVESLVQFVFEKADADDRAEHGSSV